MDLFDNTCQLAVAAAEPAQQAEATILAAQLGLPYIDLSDATAPLLLVLTPNHLEVRQTGPESPGPIWVDFVAGALDYRRRHGGGRNQALARAVGLKGGKKPVVFDATAGLGRDAFILASLGCRVLLAERSPVLAALLADGLARAILDPEISPLIQARMTLLPGDSINLLQAGKLAEKPDVVYVDPMHPARDKLALVKKDMRLLRLLVGSDQDAPQLLAAALATATKRVVVKRPRLAPAIAGPEPNFAVTGRSSRFDVYLR